MGRDFWLQVPKIRLVKGNRLSGQQQYDGYAEDSRIAGLFELRTGDCKLSCRILFYKANRRFRRQVDMSSACRMKCGRYLHDGVRRPTTHNSKLADLISLQRLTR